MKCVFRVLGCGSSGNEKSRVVPKGVNATPGMGGAPVQEKNVMEPPQSLPKIQRSLSGGRPCDFPPSVPRRPASAPPNTKGMTSRNLVRRLVNAGHLPAFRPNFHSGRVSPAIESQVAFPLPPVPVDPYNPVPVDPYNCVTSLRRDFSTFAPGFYSV